MKLSKKLPLVILATAAVAILIIGGSDYFRTSSALRHNAETKLNALMQVRKESLASYLDTIRQDLRFQAANPIVVDALGEFTTAWHGMGGGQTEKLQKLYINDNPHPTGKKEELDLAPDGSAYSRIHGKYHPWLRTFLRERGYYDIFLFDTKGNLVYTVFKELDYATNLATGKWRDTDLGNAFRSAVEKPKAGTQNFFDFKPYAPSAGAPAAFISTPVFDRSGKNIGALAFQMPIDKMNEVMQSSVGLGKTGETYIVGADHLMRSNSRFSKEATILTRKIDTVPAQFALDGKTGVMEAKDYRGVDVVSAYGLLEFLGARWALLGEADSAEVFAELYN
ncbi:MAG: cache domain-containing protein, partial [Rhodospirillales bacterium]|nr:cache domain-containing protein [Rhodospirillales bacterium]